MILQLPAIAGMDREIGWSHRRETRQLVEPRSRRTAVSAQQKAVSVHG